MELPGSEALDRRGTRWTSGIYKFPVSEPVWVSKAGMAGDGQADLRFHGGPDNVLLAYDAAHYTVWRRELGLPDLAHGSFGENCTLSGDFSDDTVCIGDTWRIGSDLLLQVTQPRQPCWKLARRIGRPDIVKRVMENAWGGWYSRILQEGSLAVGMPVELMERRYGDWPVSRAVRAMYERNQDPAPARRLAALPELSARWKQELIDESAA